MTFIEMLMSSDIAVQVRGNLYKWVHNGTQYIAEVNPRNGCIQVSNGLIWRECYRNTPVDRVYAEFSL